MTESDATWTWDDLVGYLAHQLQRSRVRLILGFRARGRFATLVPKRVACVLAAAIQGIHDGRLRVHGTAPDGLKIWDGRPE